MEHLPALFSDLALILVTAGITTLLFKWLKQPVVLGYIIAGVLIGPYMTWFPGVTDHESVELWSEIGMVFLLFAIGLEFSFKKLKKVGGTVGITALTEVVSMCIIGFFLGKLLGWTQMDSIFLGCMLAMSSTTIIAKAFEDMKLMREKFAQSVIGVLVVEDLAAILMMVLLSTLAQSTSFDGVGIVMSVVRLVFFLLVFYIIGMFVIPTLLKGIRKFMSEETLTVVAVGLCFTMVWIATSFGFSSALGAFLIGSILAETLEAELVHKLTKPIKDLFGAVFFVSVGMMVNPSILVQYWWQILLITVVVITLKSLSSGVGMLLAGSTLKDSVRAGVCYGQIGEFSFIIATVGMSFGVIDEFLYPIIVSVSIITTFITPYAIKSGLPLFNWIDRKIPEQWKDRFSNKEAGLQVKNGSHVDMNSFLRRQLKNMVIYTSIIIAVMLISYSICAIFMNFLRAPWNYAIGAAVTLTLLSPFLWTVGFKHTLSHTTHKLLHKNKLNKAIVIGVFVLRFIIVWGFACNVLRHFMGAAFWKCLGIHSPVYWWINLGFGLIYTLALRVMSPAMNFSKRIEKRFLENLNHRQSLQVFVIPEILQENCHLQKMTLSPDSKYAGLTIIETDFRDNFNVSVVSVERGKQVIELPKASFMLFPYDRITFVGHEDHLRQLVGRIEVFDDILVNEHEQSDVDLHKVSVRADSPYCGVKLVDSDLASRYNAMVIALERNGDFILNPSPRVAFAPNDIVWFVASAANTEVLLSL